MSSERLLDVFLDLQESNKELEERLRVACETIDNLKRVNKEWEILWKPIDELVRPLTPLGESVSDKVVVWIKQGMFYDPFKEMNRAYEEFFGRQKEGLKAELSLQAIAKIAHGVGVFGYKDDNLILERIREITLPLYRGN